MMNTCQSLRPTLCCTEILSGDDAAQDEFVCRTQKGMTIEHTEKVAGFRWTRGSLRQNAVAQF